MAAGRFWVLSGLLYRSQRHNYKLGGPRGGWWAVRCLPAWWWGWWREHRATPAEGRGLIGGRREPWAQGPVAEAGRPRPTQLRIGADGPQRTRGGPRGAVP